MAQPAQALGFSTLYRVDAIEAPATCQGRCHRRPRFSTLYRVDAIEAYPIKTRRAEMAEFQYPLSGRCY